MIARLLRERGQDVEAITGSPHEGVSDAEVMELARARRRVTWP